MIWKRRFAEKPRIQVKKFAMIAGIVKKNFGDIVGGDTTGRQSPSGYDEWSAE